MSTRKFIPEHVCAQGFFIFSGRQLQVEFNIAHGATAAGEDLPGLDKGQRLGEPLNLTSNQPGAAGAAVALPALILYVNLVEL